MLKRAPRTLREATVTATKVMMVMKGDTIVYNADAFELAEGSMLDQLISRLPGVKLNAGGVITVNGNRVSNLLIDGKDFFNGDANVALENLPAYMVKNVKSYQKAPDNAYLTRKDNKPHADDPWVIDVTLKKEYHQGWIANAEAGGVPKINTWAACLERIFLTEHVLAFMEMPTIPIATNALELTASGRTKMP